MELIYTDKNYVEQGILKNYSLDMAFGEDENDFELETRTDSHVMESGCLFYGYNSEIGGVVDGIAVDTSDNKLTYSGRTWHGILEKKILEPASGNDYYTLSGELNAIIGKIITDIGMDDLFYAPSTSTGISVTYQFDRYTDAYKGICKMLKSKGYKLKIYYDPDVKKVHLEAVPLIDYSKDEEFDESQFNFKIKKSRTTNHLICLGQGELKERTVVHLYANSDKEIVDTQCFFGIDEIIEIYENTGDETEAVLKEDGIKRFEDILNNDSIDTSFDEHECIYDIGDIVGGKEYITETTVSEYVTKKIVKIKDEVLSIDCEVG